MSTYVYVCTTTRFFNAPAAHLEADRLLRTARREFVQDLALVLASPVGTVCGAAQEGAYFVGVKAIELGQFYGFYWRTKCRRRGSFLQRRELRAGCVDVSA